MQPSPPHALREPRGASFDSMNFFRSDHLFEEAARSADNCDKLLKRLQRERKLNLIFLLAQAFVALALCIAAFIPFIRWLRSPTFPLPPALAWIVSSISPSFIYAISVPFFMGLAVQFGFMLHNDVCIKMLLFSRGHQARLNTANENTRNA